MPLLTRIGLMAMLAAALAAAGCFGGDDDTRYSHTDTQQCLEQAGVDADPGNADEVGGSADEGALGVTFPNNFVTIAFDSTVETAKGTEEQYGVTEIAGHVERKGTVTLAWDNEPSDEERERVDSCLKPAGE